jgi:hypothetical protein
MLNLQSLNLLITSTKIKGRLLPFGNLVETDDSLSVTFKSE